MAAMHIDRDPGVSAVIGTKRNNTNLERSNSISPIQAKVRAAQVDMKEPVFEIKDQKKNKKKRKKKERKQLKKGRKNKII